MVLVHTTICRNRCAPPSCGLLAHDGFLCCDARFTTDICYRWLDPFPISCIRFLSKVKRVTATVDEQLSNHGAHESTSNAMVFNFCEGTNFAVSMHDVWHFEKNVLYIREKKILTRQHKHESGESKQIYP